jgi:Dipeptidyl peptidase IV (DPP IV) N-terminal region/WD40-like Beta Propeller Repeat
MSSLKTGPSKRSGRDRSRRSGVTRVPRRPPGLGEHASDFDWQQALIEEARLRARKRRQRYAALVLGGLAVAVLVGFTGGSGRSHPRDLSAASAPLGTGTAMAGNGKVAFADDLGRLQVAAPDGSEAQVIEHCEAPGDGGCGLVQPAWSPDGKQIAFVRGSGSIFAGDQGMRLELSLYLRDSDGKVRRLAGCGSCGRQFGGRLSWSPDSSSIAFSREGERWTQSLWAVDTASGKLRRLTDCQACADVTPAWAPSGHLIAFNRLARAREASGLYTVRADGSELTKITDSVTASNPQWSPDGRQIAYDDNNDIFIANAGGSEQRRLVDGVPGNGPGIPSWSPDGSKLAYFFTPGSPGSFTAEVWAVNTDGLQKRRLYHSACCVGSWAPPIWSPDGRKIAFAADSAGGTFVVDSDGTNLRRLSTASANGITWQRLR